MHLKYTEIELKIAMLAVARRFESEEELTSKFEALVDTHTGTNVEPESVAKHNGITALELANSPNRETLVKEYMELMTSKLISDIKTLGFTDKEAWALFCTGTGVI